MTPPHWHKHVDDAFSAGCPLTSTVGLPGIHGAVVTGMHGCGVNVPIAAAVAAATCGLLGVVHIPNGAMATAGAWSWMVAAGEPAATTGDPCGTAVSVLGDTPNEQANVAVPVT